MNREVTGCVQLRNPCYPESMFPSRNMPSTFLWYQHINTKETSKYFTGEGSNLSSWLYIVWKLLVLSLSWKMMIKKRQIVFHLPKENIAVLDKTAKTDTQLALLIPLIIPKKKEGVPFWNLIFLPRFLIKSIYKKLCLSNSDLENTTFTFFLYFPEGFYHLFFFFNSTPLEGLRIDF